MAAATSPLFERLAKAWKQLHMRSDVDDIILELLGRFSLEKIYCDVGNREIYPRLVGCLLSQLTVIFQVQLLTFPSENVHPGPYLGLIASWEVIIRSAELILGVMTDARDLLWEYRWLRDQYLARFLLIAIRLLTQHPRKPSGQHIQEHRHRFARLNKSLECVFDSYPGNKSVLLLLCKEVTSILHKRPTFFDTPSRLNTELPNLTSNLFPLSSDSTPSNVLALISDDSFAGSWLCQVLTLRDFSFVLVGASFERTATNKVSNIDFQLSCASCRDAIFHSLDTIQLPSHISRTELMASFVDIFRIILPDTLQLIPPNAHIQLVDDHELDALDALTTILRDRQIIHRVSDGPLMRGVTQVIRSIGNRQNESGQSEGSQLCSYVVNCSRCHILNYSQMQSFHGLLHAEPTISYINLPPKSKCIHCKEDITLARELGVPKQASEIFSSLEVDASAINVGRHLNTAFQTHPGPSEVESSYTPDINISAQKDEGRLHSSLQIPDYFRNSDRTLAPNPTSPSFALSTHSLAKPPSSQKFSDFNIDHKDFRTRNHSGSYSPSLSLHNVQDTVISPLDPPSTDIPNSPCPDGKLRRASEASTEKGKAKWKLPFVTSKKPPTGVGDTSSLSSTSADAHKTDEISVQPMIDREKRQSRMKTNRKIQVQLSQSSMLILWAQSSLEVWNIGISPPVRMGAIETETTCIQAAIGKSCLAYITGTRDQELMLKIFNIAQPSIPMIEYRMPSSPWCKSIAIDKNDNYVAVGFENSFIRFFKVMAYEPPREVRLHQHLDCRACPNVDTISFSNDGLALVASTRNSKTGMIQLFLWRFPFQVFQELISCRYMVPLHESEDNGTSAALYRPGLDGDGTICITTWTQSGAPVLIDARTGRRTLIKSENPSRHGKLGNRIQCAAFSSSGQQLALVNDKGNVFHVSNVNSRPVDAQKIAASKELTVKSSSYSMNFVTTTEGQYIVLAWVDTSKATVSIKRIPTNERKGSVPRSPAMGYLGPEALGPLGEKVPNVLPVELVAEHGIAELDASGFN